jgi:tetratricopeptide (TPR) repeat protein
MLWGDLCLDAGRYAEAEARYRKALEVNEGIGNRAMVTFDSQRLAHVLILQSRRDEAAIVLEHCAELETSIVHEQLVHWEKSLTRPDNIDLGHLQLRLAAREAASGDRLAAIETCRRAIGTFEREWSDRHPEAAGAARAAHAIFHEKQISEHPEDLRLAPLLV